MWRLKSNQPEFEVVDGPMKGRRYSPGQQYAEIPESERCRFVKIEQKKMEQQAKKTSARPTARKIKEPEK